jgi:hypothetical protein
MHPPSKKPGKVMPHILTSCSRVQDEKKLNEDFIVNVILICSVNPKYLIYEQYPNQLHLNSMISPAL